VRAYLVEEDVREAGLLRLGGQVHQLLQQPPRYFISFVRSFVQRRRKKKKKKDMVVGRLLAAGDDDMI